MAGPRADIALLTDRRYTASEAPAGDWYLSNILADDRLLAGALAARGLSSVRLDWADDRIDWGAFRAVVFRTTWDYYDRQGEFAAWLDRVGPVARLINDTATVRIAGAAPSEVKVRVGETLPGSRLVVVKVQRRMSSGKANLGEPTEVSVLELKDTGSGATRELISGVPSSAHDPVALVEDANTGKRYTASPGQRFHDAAGAEYVIKDVRPNQIIVAEVATGAVHTLPLCGPRG